MIAGQPDRTRWIALSLVPGLGRRGIERLAAQFGTLDAVLHADAAALQAVKGVGPRLAAAMLATDLERTAAALDTWTAGGVAIWLPDDADYPAALRDLPDGPSALFARGSVAPGDERAIALVGTRRPRPDSLDTAARLAALSAAQGWTVVSGLAEGIDTAAHRAALDAGGRTLAVLGCGVNAVYPPQNRALAERVAAAGALLSETGPEASPSAPLLVARNRLISGLSRAVIVVETGVSGGSMHTARFASAQGRPLYAVRDGSSGTEQLIAQGAGVLEPGAGLADAWAAILDHLTPER
jgi:DNA processing protein